jgi:hypothetical protein
MQSVQAFPISASAQHERTRALGTCFDFGSEGEREQISDGSAHAE